MKPLLYFSLCGLWLSGCSTGGGPTNAPSTAATPGASARTSDSKDSSRALTALLDTAWEDSASRFPEWATYRGDNRFGDKLSDASEQGLAARDAQTRRFLAQAQSIARGPLSPTERVSLDMFIGMQQRFIEQAQFPAWRSMSLGALGGMHTQLADLLSISPTGSAQRVQQMLARMNAYPQRVDQEIVQLRKGLAAGWVPPKEVLQRVLAQLDGQVPADVEASPFYAPFKRLPGSLAAAERSELQAAARAAISSQVAPAQRRLRAFVADEYLPKAPADGALKNYPQGVQVYDMLVRHQTTTNLGAQAIHDIGQRELKRLRAEMDAIRTQSQFEGDWAQYIRYLNTDPQFFHTSPEALLAGYRDIAKKLDFEMPKLFAELPRAPYGVAPMPAHMGSRAEYYNGPALDGSRGGTFFADSLAYRTKPKWQMETLVAHEAVPGHHLQVARATELLGLPNFRRSGFGYTAFSEGWALYAETLGFDLGLYTAPTSRFGHLQWQAFRAARLVVDTGYHALGWSRQRCIDFMVDETGVNRDFVTAEIDRYTSQPGQALAYMVGKLKFDELRDRAKAKLGARFDIRRFHNAVLDQGALPLSTLENLVDEWIEAQPKGA